MKKTRYAWVICLSCLWMFVCNMGLCSNILSVYLPFIEASGLRDSMGSAILSVRCLASFVTTFFVDLFFSKVSLRRGVLLASLAGALSALVFSLGGRASVYYLGAILAGVAYGAGCVYPVSLLLTNWFNTHRGLAVGISSAGSGVASMAFAPLLSAVVVKYSLAAAFRLQAGFMLMSAIVVFLLVRDKPSDMGLIPYGQSEGNTKAKAMETTEQRPLSRRGLWALALMMLLVGGAGQAFAGHLSVLTVSCGYGVRAAATVVSLQGMVLVCSKFLSGGMADRFGTRRCTAMLMVVFLLGCLAVQMMDGVSLFWCFAPVALMGFGASVYNVGPPLWAADLSSQGGYPKLLRWLQLFYNLGGILFSAMPGLIADHTGEYKGAYLLIAAMMLVSLGVLLWAYGDARRRELPSV